jgi:hypothetical protein
MRRRGLRGQGMTVSVLVARVADAASAEAPGRGTTGNGRFWREALACFPQTLP